MRPPARGSDPDWDKGSCRTSPVSRGQMMSGSWCRKGGGRTGVPSQGTADGEAWKEKRPLPKELTLDSSLSNSIFIHQEIILALPSKHIQYNPFSPQPLWSCQWLGGEVGMKQRGGEHWEDIHAPREVGMGPNPAGFCKPVEEFGRHKAF